MTGHFLKRVQYSAWANARVLEMLSELSELYETRPLLLLSHLLRAERVWLDRIEGTAEALALWEADTVAGCRERLAANTADLRALLSSLNETALGNAVAYTDSKGTPHRTALADLLEHLFNHGTHHRGQIALLVREAGRVPLALDVIAFVRERQ